MMYSFFAGGGHKFQGFAGTRNACLVICVPPRTQISGQEFRVPQIFQKVKEKRQENGEVVLNTNYRAGTGHLGTWLW